MRVVSLGISTAVGVAVLAVGGPAFATDDGKLSIDPSTPKPGETVQLNGSCPGGEALRSLTSAAFSSGVAKITPTDSPKTFSGTAEIRPDARPGQYTVKAKCEGGKQVTHKFKVVPGKAETPETPEVPEAPVGEGRVEVSPRTARPGQTVKITGTCPVEDKVKSITSKAFADGSLKYTLKDSPLEFAATARIARSAKADTYTVRAACAFGKPMTTKIKITTAKAGSTEPEATDESGTEDTQNQASQVRQVPRGGAKTGELPETGADDSSMLLGAGVLGGAALLGGFALARRRRSGAQA